MSSRRRLGCSGRFNHCLYYTIEGGDFVAVYKDNVTKTWFCKFRYKDWQGKSHVTTKRGFKTQREAKAYEAERQAKASPEATLSDVLTAFLRDRKPSPSLPRRKSMPSTARAS